MKLNNRGWGLNFLIIVGVLFILLLIFVSLRIKAVTHQVKKDNTNNNSSQKSNKDTISNDLYISLEQSLKKAGESYSVYHSSLIENTTDHLIVWFDTLKSEGFIETLKDPDDEGNCNGYVFIKNDYSIDAYVKCDKYETLNYSLWVD